MCPNMKVGILITTVKLTEDGLMVKIYGKPVTYNS